MSKLDTNGKPIINGENGVLDMSRAIGKVTKKGYSGPLRRFLKRKTNSDYRFRATNSVDFAVRIPEKKIAYLESVDAKMFYLNIGMLKDLIRV
jgi:hypothetical protein